MFIRQIRGFKYPDIDLVRWFFKEGLDSLENARVLELGAHNGNNLSLFANYNYECFGVELDEKNVQNALYNFKEVMAYDRVHFYRQDMQDFVKNCKDLRVHVLLIANVINYISKDSFKHMLENCKKNRLYGGGYESLLFLKARSIKDHRYGLGKRVADGSFILTKDEFSGEKNCLCTAYLEHELVEILQQYLNLYDFEVLTSENINIKNRVYIKDSDIIIYGKIR